MQMQTQCVHKFTPASSAIKLQVLCVNGNGCETMNQFMSQVYLKQNFSFCKKKNDYGNYCKLCRNKEQCSGVERKDKSENDACNSAAQSNELCTDKYKITEILAAATKTKGCILIECLSVG